MTDPQNDQPEDDTNVVHSSTKELPEQQKRVVLDHGEPEQSWLEREEQKVKDHLHGRTPAQQHPDNQHEGVDPAVVGVHDGTAGLDIKAGPVTDAMEPEGQGGVHGGTNAPA